MANTFTFANLTLTDADIFGGINYVCDLNTGDEFSIGNTASASVRFVTDTQLPLYSKDSTNGTFTWTQDNISRGRWFITEVTKTQDKYEVTAYDAMILLETSVTALSLAYPLSVATAAAAIASFINCTTYGTIYNSTMTAADGTIDDTVTIRKLLGWVAEASGCSVKIDGADQICFMYYPSSGITISSTDYKEFGLEVADYTCAAIDNVTICDMAGMTAATSGAGTNSLFIQGNPFLYEATNTEAAVILGLVDSFVYAPFTCEMFEENGLEVGVMATFGSTSTLVMHLESSENGAVASAVGSDTRAEFNKSIDIIVNEALAVANDAQQTAQATNLHFWYTATGTEAGAHIAEVDKPTFEATPSGGNVLIDSNSLDIRNGTDILATFGSDGAHIQNGSGTQIAHLGYGLGNAQSGTANAPYFTLGSRAYGSTVGNWSVAEGLNLKSSAFCSHAEGNSTTASVAYSHAEGVNTTASGYASHAEGWDTTASVSYSHAEGYKTRAAHVGAHAEGQYTEASGDTSHAQNYYTKASSQYQTALGKYNEEDTNDTYAVIIGNGTADNARSNALTVDWGGDVCIALDTTAASGTDHDIYAALVALGWDSDVIV